MDHFQPFTEEKNAAAYAAIMYVMCSTDPAEQVFHQEMWDRVLAALEDYVAQGSKSAAAALDYFKRSCNQ